MVLKKHNRSVVCDVIDGKIRLNRLSQDILSIGSGMVYFLSFELADGFDVLNISRAEFYNARGNSARVPICPADEDEYEYLHDNVFKSKIVDGWLVLPKGVIKHFESATRVLIKDMGYYIFVKILKPSSNA